MKILFVASEVNPILKVGGIADVISSLAKEIKKAGHDVRIAIPFYQTLKEKEIKFLQKISCLNIKIGQSQEKVSIFQTVLSNTSLKDKYTQIPIYLFENNRFLSKNGVYLDSQKFLYLTRFLFFSQAVLEIFKPLKWTPDVIHCHDWQAGLVALFLKLKNKDKGLKIKVLFTIHNLLIQGRWNHYQVLEFLGLKGDEVPSLLEKMPGLYGDDFNVLQQAILNADLISVVSPNYAKEIKTKTYYARGLQKVIQKRKKDIIGILNGIDIDFFNPETDQYIKEQYSIKKLELKAVDKLDLQKEVGLKQDPSAPLLAMISRLDIQKGVDLVCQAADKIIEQGAQLVFLAKGQEKYETMLKRMAQKHPDQVGACIKFDSKLAQKIYAGADIFLMPSRFEPCGLSQLIAMRYGTIPVVRSTGGLYDTVENVKLSKTFFGFKKQVQGTGFTFQEFSLSEFLAAIDRATKIYQDKEVWKKIQINAMKQNFSWQRSAQKYLDLYKKLIHK